MSNALDAECVQRAGSRSSHLLRHDGVLGRPHAKVAYIDVVPSSLFLTVSTERRMRECVKRLAEVFTGSSAKVSVLHFAETKKSQRLSGTPLSHLPQKSLWWNCLPDPERLCPTANGETGETAYVRAWQPILRLKRAYETLRPQQVEVSRLSSGLFPADNISTPELPLATPLQGDGLNVHFRMGAPVSSALQDLFITTPPSLTSALNVALEICRSWVESNRHDTQSNLSMVTLGVLENWVEFFTHGRLLDADTDKLSINDEAWMRTNSATDIQRATCGPSPITIAILCEDATPEEDSVDPHLIAIASAWRNVIDNCAAEGFIILVKDVEEINESLAKKVLCLCNERLTP
ncbi:hypothetical protein SprV_0200713500 [Sparganum proliferum]